MTAKLDQLETEVPLRGNEDVTLEPGYPWPSAYRGSKYSLLHSSKHNQLVMAWKYDDLQTYLEPPEGIPRAMQAVGKSEGDGTGSFRVTAGKEVLTKVRADGYRHSDLAPSNDGWVPVYLGKLKGSLDFTDIVIDPEPPRVDEIGIWEGLPFNHGERWTVSADRNLIWKRQGYRKSYRFESGFDHSELIALYSEYRSQPGRVYVNEFGHIWVNIPTQGVPSDKGEAVQSLFDTWREDAKRNGKSEILRLVRRRLEATGGGNPAEGHLPVYLGHVSDFDGGYLPRPIVDDMDYFVDEGKERLD